MRGRKFCEVGLPLDTTVVITAVLPILKIVESYKSYEYLFYSLSSDLLTFIGHFRSETKLLGRILVFSSSWCDRIISLKDFSRTTGEFLIEKAFEITSQESFEQRFLLVGYAKAIREN